jgi:hypothetical protein
MSETYQLSNNTGDFANGDLDIVFDNVGRLVVLTKVNKLAQDVEKILFTELNKFYPQYGTIIQDVIGTTPNIDAFKLKLAQRITDSLLYLQFLQKQQQKYQKIDGAELLYKINSVNIVNIKREI